MVGLSLSTLYYLFKADKNSKTSRMTLFKRKLLIISIFTATVLAVVGLLAFTTVLFNYYIMQVRVVPFHMSLVLPMVLQTPFTHPFDSSSSRTCALTTRKALGASAWRCLLSVLPTAFYLPGDDVAIAWAVSLMPLI